MCGAAGCWWAPSSSILLVVLVVHQRKGFREACSAETVRGLLHSAPFRASLHITILGVKGKKTYLAKKTYLLQKLMLVRYRELGLGDTAFCLQGFSSCERQELHLLLMPLLELDSIWVFFFCFRCQVQFLWVVQVELCQRRGVVLC